MKPMFAAMIRDSLTDDDREFCRTATEKQLPGIIRSFCRMIDGDTMGKMKYYYHAHVSPIVAMPERLLRHYIIKPLKKRLKAA
jgi:hypothetical protein